MAAEVDFLHNARQILAACAALTVAGVAFFFFDGGLRPAASFLFGAAASVSLLALLARTLTLLDVTGTEGSQASGAAKASLIAGQLLIFPVVAIVLKRFPVDGNAVAAGFGVAVAAATLQQAVGLLRK